MSELFLSVLNMSLTASYVILFVILVRLLLKKAPKFISYVLWGVVAFRLMIPFSFESMFSLLPRNTNTAPIPHDIIYQQNPKINSGIKVVDAFVSQSLPAPTIGASVNPLQIYIEIGAYIWILGMIALLIYSLVSIFSLERKLKSAQLIEKNIFEAENLKTPFVIGFLRPRIYLPAGLGLEERSYILLHEQTHIHRKDYIIKILAFLILSIHWFNPIVWIAFMLMSTDMELSCDERVMKEIDEDIKKPYANSLLSLATGRHILNGSPLAFDEGNVKGRIKNVLNYRKPSFWIIISAVVTVAVVSIGLLANPKKHEPILNTEDSISYELIQLVNGEVQYTISPLSGDNVQLAKDVIMNYMVKSAAWPGIDIRTLEECYLLRETYSDGTTSGYYAYLHDGKTVMQRGMDGYYSRIDDGLYEKLVGLVSSSTTTVGGMDEPININANIGRTNLGACVSHAILNANTNWYKKGDFAAEAHTVLKAVEKGSTTIVYAMVLYMEFGYAGSGFFETGGSHMPVAITFNKNTEGEYELIEYWAPKDGSLYAPSIEEKFPLDIHKDALDTQKYVVAHIQSCYEQAIKYGEINADVEIAKLIEMITSSPAHMSSPHPYIQEHIAEYRELIYYGKHTLRYCFTLFEQGGQTGLDGHIMASACRDILGEEDIKLLANTGQDWYNAFKKHIENLRDKNGSDYIKKNMSGSWLLLQMLDE